ncbi:MAG: hypothetical protein QM778_08485 [Myxococcales bacterium]
MGLFDFLNKKSPSSPVQKLAVKAADKRGMAPDRWEALQALSRIESEEAIEALLHRFTFYVDPSITDQEEKDSVFESIVAKGTLAAAPLKRFIRKSESLSWPLKMLDRVLPADDVLAILLELMGSMDTEYERDPTRKLQLLAELESRRGPGVVQVVLPFLKDVNETARFHAVGALFAQEEDASEAREALLELLGREDSMRTKARLLDGFTTRAWSVDPARAGRLPDGFALDPSGLPRRR